jgi:hypothetical protein
VKVECNATLRCDAKCRNCDRHVPLFPNRTDVSLEQISDFIDQAEARKTNRIDKLKLVGGQATEHPQFSEVYELLLSAAERGVIREIKITTNCLKPNPPVRPSSLVRWQRSPPKKKQHLPSMWAAVDLGLPWKPCRHPFQCGFSLDNRGWLPCSPMISIARLFGREDLYQDKLPDGVPWGMECCKWCCYALPEPFRREWCKPLAQHTPEMLMPTRSWAEALRKAGIPVEQAYEPQVF